MPLFDSKILRNVSSPEAFRRGKKYVDDDAVDSIRIERLPSGDVFVVGTVYGSYTYHTKLTLNQACTQVIGYDCDCPSRGEDACKHVVALGLIAARRSVISTGNGRNKKNAKQNGGQEIDTADHDLLETLRTYAEKRGAHADDEHLAKTVKELEALLVQKGVSVTHQAPHVRPQEFVLGDIECAFSYLQAHDVIRVNISAIYGSMSYPLEGWRLLHGEEDGKKIALRDWREERAAAVKLERFGFHLVDTGVFEMPAASAYLFLREGLFELGKKYRVLGDDAFEALATIQKKNVESDWDLSESSGEDWLTFSVAWKCGDRPLTPEEIEGLSNGLDRYVRNADGSFVEIENQQEVNRLWALTKDALPTTDGTFKLLRTRAMELAYLAEENGSMRLFETSASIQSFLRDAKEGTLAVSPKIPKHLLQILRPYQQESVAWAMFLRAYKFGGVLADDMGLGKTLQALAILSTERKDNTAPSLVICPKTLVAIWVAEAKRFTPELSVIAIEGTAKERAALLKRAQKCDVIVTSYSLLQRDAKLYQSMPLFYAILDEAQYVKNSKTTTALAVKTLKAEHRLALTGTPLENGVHELWSLFDFLMPGLLGDRAAFRSEFERPIRERNDMGALHVLKRRVKPFLLRRTKESVAPELPPRMEETNWCELTPVQASLYAEVLASVRRDVFAAVEKKGFARSRIEILAALTKLRQVCNHPSLVDKRLSQDEEASGKMAYALELVREAALGGHKILLFSQFTSMLDLIRPALDAMDIGHVTIEGKTQKRGEVVEKFKQDDSVSVFLLSLRAAGTGLTLTEADTVILFDPWWNPMVERQAMDRAHRIGQTKSVNVHKLVTKGTIEERVLALQEKKKAVFDAMVSETSEGINALTWEDVQDMFAEV